MTCSKYAENQGTSLCSNCAAGKFGTAGASRCTDCDAGKFSVAGSSTCTDCAPGRFQSAAGASTCDAVSSLFASLRQRTSFIEPLDCAFSVLQCTLGQVAGGTGRTICSACSSGQVRARAPLPSIASCDSTCLALCDQFANSTGRSVCLICVPGKYAPAAVNGANNCQSCAPGR